MIYIRTEGFFPSVHSLTDIFLDQRSFCCYYYVWIEEALDTIIFSFLSSEWYEVCTFLLIKGLAIIQDKWSIIKTKYPL